MSAPAGRTRVLFLINSLSAGGAERQLSQLVRAMDPARFEIHLAVHYGPGARTRGELWPEVAAVKGVTLHDLRKRRGPLGYLTSMPRLLWLSLRIRPHIVHGYLQGNLALLPVALLMRLPLVWGIRRATADLTKLDRRSLRAVYLLNHLSRFADLIIFNSEAGSRNYQAMGMRAKRMEVIPNGFDIARFQPDPSRGAAQREAWGVAADAPLVGIAGRLDPVKDHPTFLRMAARLSEAQPEMRFVCIGDGDPAYRASLQALAGELGIADKVRWPGVCLDMASAYNALSALVLCSTDEGFPNVLGEAMACGVPCATTPAGDAARLVGDTGLVAPIGDDGGLASAASRLLGEPAEARARRAEACRARIREQFSIEALARTTEDALLSTLRAPKGGPRYLLRFDDLCPTVDWKVWDAIEEMLVARGVRPLMAVIPDNQDPKLVRGPAAPDFWDRVRAWQARGWAIGLHGHQHLYTGVQPGILSLSSKTEFAGLPAGEQARKLRLALDIFEREGVRPDAWVAPSHSFDWTTVSVLNELGLRTISDGLAFRPYLDAQGNTWVPQQSATMRRMPFGVWTFCYHEGDLRGAGLAAFERKLAALAPRMISFPEAAAMAVRGRSPADRIVSGVRRVVSAARALSPS